MPPRIEIYDPPLCCPTGICGPEIDPVLPRVASDVEWLRTQGADVGRYNLAQEPDRFVGNGAVRKEMAVAGLAALPLVCVDGEVLSRGIYPSREDLARFAGIPFAPAHRGLALPALAPESNSDSESCCGDRETPSGSGHC